MDYCSATKWDQTIDTYNNMGESQVIKLSESSGLKIYISYVTSFTGHCLKHKTLGKKTDQ